MKIKFRQFMVNENVMSNAVPMRVMKGVIEKESTKAYYVKLQGFIEPSSNCNHCGRKIKNPVSLLYGLGMYCGEHFGIPKYKDEQAVKDNYDKLKSLIEDIKFEGWVAKRGIEEIIYEVEFYHNGIRYVDHTSDFLRIEKIKKEAEKYFIY